MRELNHEDIEAVSVVCDEEIEFYLDEAAESASGEMEVDVTANDEKTAYVELAKSILDADEFSEEQIAFGAEYMKDKFKAAGCRLEVAGDGSVSFCWG